MNSAEPQSSSVSHIEEPYQQPMAVMFVDLDHFMRTCIDLPAGQVFLLIEAFQRLVADTVASFAGSINSYQGDGILAVFGDQPGRADCATRSLDCAQTILGRISVVNLKRILAGERSMSVSIGLQYGPVWTGTIGISQRFGPTLIGDAINVAVRLEQHARALGTKIVVGDDLMRQARCQRGTSVRELVRFVDAGSLFVGGRGDPVDVWVLQTQASEISTEILPQMSSIPSPDAGAAPGPDDRAPEVQQPCIREERCTCNLPHKRREGQRARPGLRVRASEKSDVRLTACGQR
jgi:class 3 adenylate cyclase